MTMPKILIGIPSSDLVQAQFMMCLLPLITGSRAVQIDCDNQRSSRITANRNNIVDTARKLGSTHILFIDADMTFPSDGLYRLLAHDKDIVCATACKREEKSEGQPIGIPMDKEDIVTSKPLIQMEVVGMPFMLVKTSVFDKLVKPYFAEPAWGEIVMPEDTYFCETVRKSGFDIWCDINLSTQMGHLGIKEYRLKPAPLHSVKAA